MKTCYYHLDHYEVSQRSVKAYAPDAEWVYTTRGEPWLYPDHVASVWGQDDLLVLEGDIIINGEVMATMSDCGRPWCVYNYPLSRTRRLMNFGYGCTKFSKELQQGFDYQRVLDHGKSKCIMCDAASDRRTGDCEDCKVSICHLHQDTAFWHEMIKTFGIGTSPHLHGTVGHLHLGTRSYLGATEAGLHVWLERQVA